MKRRDFLHNFAHAAALPTIFSSLGFSNLDFKDFLNNSPSNKRLILIRLDGGNDGLNTLIPLDQYSELTNVRPHVIIPENKILSLGQNDLGLHPELTTFKSLFDENRLKIIQNVGYQTPDFSHFRSMDIWQSASDSNQYLTSGWIGRYLEEMHPNFPEQYPTNENPHPLAVELGYSSSLLTTGLNSVTSYTSNNPSDYREIIGDFDNTYPEDTIGKKLKFIQIITRQSNIYGEALRNAFNMGNNNNQYPSSDLGNQLQVASSLIKGGLKSKIYIASIGGFDTHGDQVDRSDTTKGAHAALMKDLNNSIGALFQDLDNNSKSEDVLVMTFSEFGRTIVSNGSYGTDHGTAAPLFIFGNKVDFNIAGANPEIPYEAEWQDNLTPEFDFRQVYFSVIKQWLGGHNQTAENVLFKQFDQIPIIQSRYIDSDNDGVSDEVDQCNSTPLGALVDTSGCVIFSLPSSNYTLQTNGVSCQGKSNGRIDISVENTTHDYSILIQETNTSYVLNAGNQHQLSIEDLGVGTYTLNFRVEGQENYLQTFEIGITQPDDFSAKTTINSKRKTVDVNLSGSDLYLVELNGDFKIYKEEQFQLALQPGYNKLKIGTPQDCQGVHEEEIFISEQINYYPNPVNDHLNIVIPGTDVETQVQLYNRSGALVNTLIKKIPRSRIIKIDTSQWVEDIYIVKVKGVTVDQNFKIQKK